VTQIAQLSPGAPRPGLPSWARTPHDGLPLPGGRLLGQVPNGELARVLLAAGVPGVDHSMGRGDLAEVYAKYLQKIHEAAGTAAVNAWVQQAGASPCSS
jgi:hypothetical protein